MFIHQLCHALDKNHVAYAIVGGYAVSLHGASRGTMDIDIAIEWNLENLKNTEKALKSLRLTSLLPINSEQLYHYKDEYILQKNLIAWHFYDPQNPIHQVDIIINYDLKHAKIDTLKTASGSIKVISRQDLIAMKKSSGRQQDIEDVRSLESL